MNQTIRNLLLLFPSGGLLPFSDSFDRANGPLDGRWLGGANWAVAGNEAVNSPVGGAEILANPGMEGVYDDESGGGGGTINVAPNWNNFGCETNGTDTLDKEIVIVHGGLAAQKCDVDALYLEAVATSVNVMAANTWYLVSAWFYNAAGTPYLLDSGGGLDFLIDATNGAVWAQVLGTGRASVARKLATVGRTQVAGRTTWYIDDASVKALTLSDLIACVEAGRADVVASVELDTVVKFTQAGLIVNLDDEAMPANFVVAYHDGTNCRLDKCVAGTYTSVINAAVAYAAGATIQVQKSGTSYKLYYNGAQVGVTSTISDAGIINNTKHGLFSTYSGNQLDDFSLVKN